MNSINTQTPLLRLFITYYSLIGTQYSLPSDWTNLTSLLRLLWNSLITSMVIYGLIWTDPFRMRVVLLLPCVDNPLSRRPLFSTFAHLSVTYAYPFVYLLYPIFGMFYGRRILQQLDCALFQQFYHSKRQAVAIFAVVLSLSHSSVLTVLFERHQVHRRLARWPTATDVIEWTALYVAFQYIFWLLHLIHYYQWATYQILLGLKEKIRKKTISESEVLTTVRSLATANAALNRLLSPLIIIYVLFLVFNFIFIACLLTMCSPSFRIYMHIYAIAIYAYYISTLNGSVQRTVAKILAELLSAHAKEKGRIGKEISSADDKLGLELQLQRLDSRRVDVLECDRLYRGHFSVHVYHLTTVDVRFLFSTALFVTAYSVFILQTSH